MVGVAMSVIGFLGIPLALIGGMVWLYQAWNSVPPDMRYTDGGK
jgi:hypothetical protein